METDCKNKHLKVDTEFKIYKSAVSPISSHTAETRPDISETRCLLENVRWKFYEQQQINH